MLRVAAKIFLREGRAALTALQTRGAGRRGHCKLGQHDGWCSVFRYLKATSVSTVGSVYGVGVVCVEGRKVLY